MNALIYQINIKAETPGERGIPKLPVDSVDITVDGMRGDYNRYRTEKKKRDPHKAVMLIPLETIQELRTEGWPIEPGHLGENITTQGVHYNFFEIGQKYKVGSSLIEITEPCTPCANLKLLPYVGEERKNEFMKILIGRRGWYAKVITEGRVAKGDGIERLLS
ncbi:MOSC domain-containing protein [Candidatus Woesearchaeota archaeon]|nr:MOSC domain-containing protein [Candidatus Woesearchaeota archaeon]